jgi:aromatase
MHDCGIIWNNGPSWTIQRKVFQRALGIETLKQASIIAAVESRKVFLDAFNLQFSEGIDVLNCMRMVTFRVTLKLFFGLEVSQFAGTDLDEAKMIVNIVSFFKAWEYLLFRPKHSFNEPSVTEHKKAISNLRNDVIQVICLCRTIDTLPSFIGDLFKLHDTGELTFDMLIQCVLEMFLAGTDTSSVSLYYAVLGLAGNSIEQDELHFDLAIALKKVVGLQHVDSKVLSFNNDDVIVEISNSSEVLHQVLLETLRVKPVGPVVIRRAVNPDKFVDSMGKVYHVNTGDGVILHLAKAHTDPMYFRNPLQFDPNRQLKDGDGFYPFGTGPKGCVGKYLGMAEMKACLAVIVPLFQFKLPPNGDSLESLETKWEIANQPKNVQKVIFLKRSVNLVVTGAHSTGKTTLCNEISAEVSLFEGNKVQELARGILNEKGWLSRISHSIHDQNKLID